MTRSGPRLLKVTLLAPTECSLPPGPVLSWNGDHLYAADPHLRDRKLAYLSDAIDLCQPDFVILQQAGAYHGSVFAPTQYWAQRGYAFFQSSLDNNSAVASILVHALGFTNMDSCFMKLYRDMSLDSSLQKSYPLQSTMYTLVRMVKEVGHRK